MPKPIWRLIASAPGGGAGNMAIDQALFESVRDGGRPVLRFYRWDPACLSLGRNQPARVIVEDLERHGIDLVRRPTGGAAVLHNNELTYSVCVSFADLGSPRVAYNAINGALRSGLAQLGVAAEQRLANTSASAFRRAGSCFAGTAPGEVGVAGRKLVGSAQRCERRTILQHGSILIEGNQRLADLLLGRPAGPDSATSLTEALGVAPGWAELQAALIGGFEREIGIALAPAELDSQELARARTLTAHYSSAAWTWRV